MVNLHRRSDTCLSPPLTTHSILPSATHQFSRDKKAEKKEKREREREQKKKGGGEREKRKKGKKKKAVPANEKITAMRYKGGMEQRRKEKERERE